MKFKDEKSFNDGIKAQKGNWYGLCCFSYAKEWAELMEARIVNGESINDIARETSYKANTNDISRFMYGMAVSILAHCWEYGEELRQWHNIDIQLDNEGEIANRTGGTLNPASLSVGY
jgi:hypothetical protein